MLCNSHYETPKIEFSTSSIPLLNMWRHARPGSHYTSAPSPSSNKSRKYVPLTSVIMAPAPSGAHFSVSCVTERRRDEDGQLCLSLRASMSDWRRRIQTAELWKWLRAALRGYEGTAALADARTRNAKRGALFLTIRLCIWFHEMKFAFWFCWWYK